MANRPYARQANRSRTANAGPGARFRIGPFAQRSDVPEWFGDIRLVLNLHCEHWTGYVFNTFDSLRDVIGWVTQRIAGRHVLAFLPGWDGRYYYNIPEYQPSTSCGGADGLRALIEHAHGLNVHVVPMYIACAAQASKLVPLGLADAVLRIYTARSASPSRWIGTWTAPQILPVIISTWDIRATGNYFTSVLLP